MSGLQTARYLSNVLNSSGNNETTEAELTCDDVKAERILSLVLSFCTLLGMCYLIIALTVFGHKMRLGHGDLIQRKGKYTKDNNYCCCSRTLDTQTYCLKMRKRSVA